MTAPPDRYTRILSGERSDPRRLYPGEPDLSLRDRFIWHDLVGWSILTK